MPVITWSEEHRKVAEDLWKKGYSAGEISKRIPGKTRNAVIGFIHRHLRKADRPAWASLSPGRNRSRPTDPKAAEEWAAKEAEKRAQRAAEKKAPTLPAIPKERRDDRQYNTSRKALDNIRRGREVDARPIEPPPQPRGDRPTLLQLQPRDCRWPYGDPRHEDFHYCGQTVMGETYKETPYCAGHARVAYDAKPSSKARN